MALVAVRRQVHAAVAAAVLLLLTAALLAVPATPAKAATFVVTANRITNSSATDDPPPDGCAVDDCSLREAVMAANASPGPDMITFAARGTVRLGIIGPDIATPSSAGDLDVVTGEDLTIMGPITIDAVDLPPSGESRIIQVDTADLTLMNATLQVGRVQDNGGAVAITDGTLTWRNGSAFSNSATLDGGAVHLSGASLVMENVTMAFNAAAGNGGAVGGDDALDIAITRVSFDQNTAGATGIGGAPGGNGGAIGANTLPDSTITITQSTFTNNLALNANTPSLGGAVALGSGTATIALTDLRDNGATAGGTTAQGGAISTEDTILTLTDSLVTGNTAADVGGGLALNGTTVVDRTYVGDNEVTQGSGGGMYAVGNPVQVSNTTVHGNTAAAGGAGLHAGPNSAIAAARHRHGQRRPSWPVHRDRRPGDHGQLHRGRAHDQLHRGRHPDLPGLQHRGHQRLWPGHGPGPGRHRSWPRGCPGRQRRPAPGRTARAADPHQGAGRRQPGPGLRQPR